MQKLREEIEKTVPKGKLRSSALERLENAAQRKKTTFPTVKNAKNVLYNHPKSYYEWPVPYLAQSNYDCELTQFLFNLACRHKYLALGIARLVSVGGKRTTWPNLAKELVDSNCKAVQELPKKLLEMLEKIAEKAQKEKNQ